MRLNKIRNCVHPKSYETSTLRFSKKKQFLLLTKKSIDRKEEKKVVMPYMAIGWKAPPFYFWLLLLSHFWINTSVDGTTHTHTHAGSSFLLVEEEAESFQTFLFFPRRASFVVVLCRLENSKKISPLFLPSFMDWLKWQNETCTF